MVVLFPGTKDQTWRWQTSNGDYGRFYLALSAEALGVQCRHDELHAECNKKCEALSRQLYELKAELQRLRIGSRLHSPRGEKPGCRSPRAHNGDCDYAARARSPCDDMYHTTHDINYNGGCRTEPQILDDHLKADHPRLVKKVQPVNPLGSACLQRESGRKGTSTPDNGALEEQRRYPPTVSSGSDSGIARQQYNSRTPDSGGASYSSGGHRPPPSPPARYTPPRARETPRPREPSPRSRDTHPDGGAATSSQRIGQKAVNRMTPKAPRERLGGGGASSGGLGGSGASGSAASVGLRGGDSSGTRSQHGGDSYPASQGGSDSHYFASRERDVSKHFPHSSLKSSGPRRKILPPSQRYNFYRYYGFAGQGAKTSRGWNPK